MNIIKRNGGKELFSPKKIVNAIEKSYLDIHADYPSDEDYDNFRNIAREIEVKLVTDEVELDVESIQDIVEDKMIAHGYVAEAKAYIKYRHEKDRFRGRQRSYKFLEKDFLSKYKHSPEPFKFDLGKVTYYRTYARPIPEENRRESWWETVARVVDFSSDLEYQAIMRANGNVSILEIENIKKTATELYDMMFNLKLFPSGRTLWVGGSKTSYENPISNFNCSFVTIDDYAKFSEMLLVLMLGTGVGLSVEQKYVSKLPKLNKKVEVIHKTYKFNPEVKEHTELVNLNDGILKIIVGDSRFGWSKAIEMFFDILSRKQYGDIDTLIIDYDYVRPYGSRIKTFGGHASGHDALQTIFQKIDDMIKSKKESGRVSIKPIDSLDIATAIAEGVVAGGTRRSALIVFCDPTDTEVLEAKKNLYRQNSKGDWEIDGSIKHRSLSNNTVFYEERPTKEQLDEQFKLIRFSGEPSFGNMAEMRRRRPDAQGGNPLTL